jgi:outer membrane protein assembly factor BamB
MNKRTLPAFLACLFAASAVLADDWPQWRGAHRDEISREKGLLKSWPEGGPKLLWTYTEAGNGYSSPAIVGSRLYTMGTEGGSDVILALDTTTGRKVWSSKLGTLFRQNKGNGPRGTPTVDGDALYALGGQGELVCVATADGKKRWAVNLKSDLGGQMMSGWGYSESPLIDGDKLICTPGGNDGTLAALDKSNGKVLWRSEGLTDKAGYSSPIAVDFGGTRMYVQTTNKGVAGVDAKDGKLLWRYEQRFYRTAVIPTPIFHDGYVYITSGYGAGCDLLKLTGNAASGFKVEKVYANKNMVNHHGGVVLLEGHLYGYSDGKGWVCQDFKSGKIVWAEKRALPKGSLTCADGQLYCYSQEDGKAVLIDASPKGWQEHGRFKIPKQSAIGKSGQVWTHPVVANGKLYLRDQDLIFCYDVKK